MLLIMFTLLSYWGVYMLEMLDKLDNSFDKKLKKEIEWKEITIFSIQLSSNSAIVLTNIYLYVLKKRIFGISCYKVKITNINNISLEEELSINFPNKNISIEVQKNKRSLAKKAVAKINYLNNDVKIYKI